jgi:hypothetical protein
MMAKIEPKSEPTLNPWYSGYKNGTRGCLKVQGV